ncbi:MAG TPA: hypothetical protein PLQ78_03830 [Flavipsychrobacter sp.]|nr:hypothetical protein [Flavipsychrobacter sp.]
MKQRYPVFIFATGLLLASCQSKEKNLTLQQVNHLSDSLTAVYYQELKAKSAEDLDRRIAIELKPIVDSIVKSFEDKQPKPLLDANLDTVLKTTITQQHRSQQRSIYDTAAQPK